MTWRTKSAMRAKKPAFSAFFAGRPLELLAAVSVTWSSLILANVGLPGSELNHGCCAGSGFPPEQLAQGRQDSNLQPAVLETAALPIAPLPYGPKLARGAKTNHVCPGFPEAHAIIVFSTPVNQSTQELRLRRTSHFPDRFETKEPGWTAVTYRRPTSNDPVNSIE